MTKLLQPISKGDKPVVITHPEVIPDKDRPEQWTYENASQQIVAHEHARSSLDNVFMSPHLPLVGSPNRC